MQNNDKKLEQRMYSMVLRQLNPMQKGIQSLHAVVAYSEEIKDEHKYNVCYRDAYNDWANIFKTMIVLDAGVYKDLIDAMSALDQLKVPNCAFYEEDLNGLPTAVCFLADERVYNTEAYPSYDQYRLFNVNEHNTIDLFPKAYTTTEVENYKVPEIEDFVSEHFCCDVEEYLRLMELRNLIFSKRLSA